MVALPTAALPEAIEASVPLTEDAEPVIKEAEGALLPVAEPPGSATEPDPIDEELAATPVVACSALEPLEESLLLFPPLLEPDPDDPESPEPDEPLFPLPPLPELLPPPPESPPPLELPSSPPLPELLPLPPVLPLPLELPPLPPLSPLLPLPPLLPPDDDDAVVVAAGAVVFV